MERAAAVRMAHDCVERLRQDPNNVPLRERFARLLAEQLGDPDRAIDQLKLLLNMPDQPRSRRAEWLSLIAAFHLKHREDPGAGRAMLEQIVRDYSDTPQAFAARRRLQLLRQPSRSGQTHLNAQ
jgi:thioredoxin-like negative regulator of GroEL